MNLPTYNGTCNPNKYINQMRAYCKTNQITNEQEILELCKLMLDSNITIPNENEIHSLYALITALKSHSTFNIFKNTCKAKLKFLKYVPENEGGDTATFLANFHSLCNDAEINNPEEIINLLLNTHSSNNFKIEFKKSANGINSLDEILKVFSDVVFDESINVIKYGSCTALKHVATGKYLSYYNGVLVHSTGRGDPSYTMAFAGQNFIVPDAIWIISKNENLSDESQEEPVFYGKPFYLIHKVTKTKLSIGDFRSPVINHAGVSTYYGDDDKRKRSQFVAINSVNGEDNIRMLSKDVIILKNSENYILQSHGLIFTGYNVKTCQEVIGHKEGIGESHEVRYFKWCIELVR